MSLLLGRHWNHFAAVSSSEWTMEWRGRGQANRGQIIQFQWDAFQPVPKGLSYTVIVAWDSCIIDAVGQKIIVRF